MGLIGASFLISKPLAKDLLKARSFECGFERASSPRIPFSIKFFLIVIVFLVFDVEIALILPLPVLLEDRRRAWTLTVALLLIILIGGLLLEIAQGRIS